MSLAGGHYTRDFQVNLLVNLAKDAKFFQETAGHLQLTDFEMPGCRLVYEALFCYYAGYHSLPDMNTLRMEIERLIVNSDGKTRTRILPEHLSDIEYTLTCIATIAANVPYYRDQINDYLQSLRMNQALVESQSPDGKVDTKELISRVTEIGRIAVGSSDIQMEHMIGNHDRIRSAIITDKIPTCMEKLNRQVAGGLTRKEIGMIVASTGLGKTTCLVNFMHSSIFAGYRSLFFSLELPIETITKRLHAITGYLPMNLFDIDIEQWPVEARKKYLAVTLPEYNKWYGYDTIVRRERKLSVNDIEQSILRWKEQTVHENGNPDDCAAVYIDWLDWISSEGLKITGKDRTDTELTKITEALADMGKRNNVLIWTATQASVKAVGKERMEISYTAQAYHKNDALDMSIGLSPKALTGDKRKSVDMDEEVETRQCDRTLVTTIMKNRRGTSDGFSFDFYQGPSLKFWNTRSEMTHKDGEFAAAKEPEDYLRVIYGDKNIDAVKLKKRTT